MKHAPLSINQLFRISWWLLVISFVASVIDYFFLESEYRDYLRILGIFAFAGYLIGLVYNMQNRMNKNEASPTTTEQKPENTDKTPSKTEPKD